MLRGFRQRNRCRGWRGEGRSREMEMKSIVLPIHILEDFTKPSHGL